MRKVLVINGSPRTENSNSYRMTKAFLKGWQEVCSDLEIEVLTPAKMNIHPCLGCYTCWKRTPGKCVQKDDMVEAMAKWQQADIIVWCFPLYFYSLPTQMKMFMDRLMPSKKPVMRDRYDGRGYGIHSTRVDQSHQKNILISTCGFFTSKGNFDAIEAQFDLILGKGNYLSLFCGQGEMMPVPIHQERVEEYLSYVTQAGRDYGTYEIVMPETRKKLDEYILPKEEFEKLGNSYYAHCEKKAKEREEAAKAEAESKSI